MRTNRPAAPATFNRIGNVGIEAVDLDVHRAGSSNPSPQEGAPNAWWYEVVVLRCGEDDFRGGRKEPAAFQIEALVQGKEQRLAETKKNNRAVENAEAK